MEMTDLSQAAIPSAPEREIVDAQVQKNAMLATAAALGLAAVLSTKSGVGLAIAVLFVALGSAVATWPSRTDVRWALSVSILAPWLVIRDNTWLSIGIVCTVGLVVSLVMIAGMTQQRVGDLSMGALLRLPARANEPRPTFDRRSTPVALFRGAFVATPIVAVFWALLASADDVFADIANPSILPLERAALFAVLLPICVLAVRWTTNGRTADAPKQREPFGVTESTVVLGAVAALFFVFITLRLATVGRQLSEEAWRSEVRSGFFQLLWVAALTVLLVLAIRQVSKGRVLTGRLRTLAFITIALAAVIDILAMVKIAEYVERSFLSPLRFWSFSFGLWLLVVLAITAVRLTGVHQRRRWFTSALVASWLVFLMLMGAVNPDQRIASHNFENPPTGEDEWIAVNPLIWLSEDATPVIVENIDALWPLPDDRYGRMFRHLCSREDDTSWRDANFSRQAAREAIEDLC